MKRLCLARGARKTRTDIGAGEHCLFGHLFLTEYIMLFYPQEKLAIFIDGANLYGAAKGLQFDIDYKRLLELFAR